jgi:hypothetical protein
MTITKLHDAEELFRRWFLNPLDVLKTSERIKDGDGGIIAMMVVMPLLERYVKYIEKTENRTRNQVFKAEFGFDDADSNAFWNIFRDGFCHQAMPIAKAHGAALPGVSFSDGYPSLPTYIEHEGQRFITMDIWKFAQWVLDKYEANPKMLEANASFPLLPIYSSLVPPV